MPFWNLFKKKANSISPVPLPAEPQPKEQVKSTTISAKVAGTKYRDQKEIRSLGHKNEDFLLTKKELIKKFPDGATIDEYKYPPCKASLEFEPTNEYDPNAIKVLIDGIHVGYIKKGSCSRIKKLISQGKIESITAQIRCEKFKSLECYVGIDEKPTYSDYVLETYSSESPSIKLTIKLHPEI